MPAKLFEHVVGRSIVAMQGERRGVTRGRSRCVNSRIIVGSGSLRQRLSGSVRSRVSTTASGCRATRPSAVSVGKADDLGVRAETELGEPDSGRPGIGGARSGCDRGNGDALRTSRRPEPRSVGHRPANDRSRRAATSCDGRVVEGDVAPPVIIRDAPGCCDCSKRQLGEVARHLEALTDRVGTGRPTTHAVDGSPSTAIAGRSSGR